jgi:phosphopantetheinyl transferase
MTVSSAISNSNGARAGTTPSKSIRVDLWAALVAEGEEPPHGMELLDQEDRQWCGRLHLASAAKQSLTAHILLRLALADAVNGSVLPAAWRFERDEHGKPRLASGFPQLHFSLSHERLLAVATVCATNPVGIDVARLEGFLRRTPVWSAVAPSERVLLFSEAADTGAHDFARLWALKEAYAKMLGLGHALDFTRLEVDLAQRRLREAEHDCKAAFETHTLWFPDDCYFVAVAVGTQLATNVDSHGHMLDLTGGAWFARSEFSPQEAVWPKRWKWHWF